MAVRDPLPEHLRRRARTLLDGHRPVRADGEFVLYWMRTAVRGHENPALDAALALGRIHEVPVFVYHALSERYPYASDRHHTFILQGARDVQAEMAARGIGYAFHLERPGHRGPHLKTLGERALAVVTEDMPVAPLRAWSAALAEAVDAPVLAVDTACLVPMRTVARTATDRAYTFRKATADAREAALRLDWEEQPDPDTLFVPADLPFEPVDLQEASVPELVGACEIDHLVGPVPHTAGGSRAGYDRWAEFRDGSGLAYYHKRRNDAARDGVSRLSPYLHYGQVSPFRIAREAAQADVGGSDKFLDELLVWREVAHAFCYHHPEHETLDVLPAWARETLRQHESVERAQLLSWEELARSRSGSRLWDACQDSLRIQGELHNNVRMSWGKAILRWTADADEGLDRMIDLNHRYALDGRDPNSYGGILWCLGQFDRPFTPARGITGTVRSRSLSRHESRLDMERYESRVRRPLADPPPRTLVVGAGVSGLTVARTLHDHGLPVMVADKGRAPGGRLATRESRDADTRRFDHGAQYFTARSPVLRRYVASWIAQGVVAPWEGRLIRVAEEGRRSADDGGPRFVGVPGMRALAEHLAADLPVHQGVRVTGLQATAEGWRVETEGGSGGDVAALREPFHRVALALPPDQAAALLDGVDDALAARCREAGVAPCWAALLTLPLGASGPEADFDGAFLPGNPLSWMARDSSKPGRPDDADRWVLHAGPEWSAAHLEDDPEVVARALAAAFADLTGADWSVPPTAADGPLPDAIRHLEAHRWRYALPVEPVEALWLGSDAPHYQAPPTQVDAFGTDEPAATGAGGGLFCCGDWCGGPRVEGAFLSGAALVGHLLRTLG